MTVTFMDSVELHITLFFSKAFLHLVLSVCMFMYVWLYESFVYPSKSVQFTKICSWIFLNIIMLELSQTTGVKKTNTLQIFEVHNHISSLSLLACRLNSFLLSDCRLRNRAGWLGHCRYDALSHFVVLRARCCRGWWNWSFRSGCMIEPRKEIRCYHSTKMSHKHIITWTNEKHSASFFVTRGTTTTGKKEPFGECEIKTSYEISEGIRKVKKE